MKTSKRKRTSGAAGSKPAQADPTPAVAVAEPGPADITPAAPETMTAEPVLVDVAQAHPESKAAEPMSAEPTPAAAAAGEPVVVLAANCSVKDAAGLKSSLRALAQQSGSVTVDARAVERVDTATMQLLCAFVRDRASAERPIAWLGAPRALQDAARLLGLGQLLQLNDPLPDGAAA